MFRFDKAGTLYARLDAPAARLTPGAWVLENACRWELDPDERYDRTASGGRLSLPTTLTGGEILDSFAPPETVGFWDLGRFIGQMEDSGFSGQRHRLFLQTELAKPALYAAMVLIGAAFALRPSRFGQTGVMILLAVLAGFALYFLKDFAELLGGQGDIPILVSAWTPPVAAILLAVEASAASRGRLSDDGAATSSPAAAPDRRGSGAGRRRGGAAVRRAAGPAGAARRRRSRLPASLVADQVTYDRDSQVLTAPATSRCSTRAGCCGRPGSSTTRRPTRSTSRVRCS